MLIVVAVPLVALLIGIVVTRRHAARHGSRWGWRVDRVDVGDGAYRSAPVEVRQERRLPLVCSAAAATSVALGLVNLAAFAPLGLLLLSSEFLHADTLRPPFGSFGVFGLILASFNGFRLGVKLIELARPLVARTRWSAGTVNEARYDAAWHHALLAVSLLLLTFVYPLGTILPYLILCAVGCAHVALLSRARAALSRADHEDRERAIA